MSKKLKKFIYIIIRICILVMISLPMSFFYFSNIEETLKINFNYYVDDVNGSKIQTEALQKKFNEFKNFEKDLNPILRIPSPFLRYKIYAKNNFSIFDKENNKIKTILGVKILPDGKYEQIETGKTKKIFNKNIAPEQFYKYSIEVKFRPEDENYNNKYTYTHESANYYFFIRPNLISFCVVLFSVMAVVYAAFLILVKLMGFIIFGSPFDEILKKE